MSICLTNKKRRGRLSLYIAAISLACNLSASSNWTVSTITSSTIPTGVGGSSVSGSGTINFSSLKGITSSSTTGNLYVSDSGHHVIFRGTPNASTGSFDFSVFAGVSGSNGDDNGPKASAKFKEPHGLTIRSGSLFITDSGNHKIRELDFASGTVSDFAGSGAPGTDNGPGTAAQFNFPTDVAVKDTVSGTLYVADTINKKIRQITSAGVVTDLSLTGYTLSDPQSLDYGDGHLYIADSSNTAPVGHDRILKIETSTGMVTSLAGGSNGSIDGTGIGAKFGYVTGILYDPSSKNLYVVDEGNNTIRQIDPSGTVTTIAGSAAAAPSTTDGTGDQARFMQLSSIAMGADGALYVTQNGAIRKLVKVSGPGGTTPDDPSRGRAGAAGGARAAAAASNATEDDGADAEEANFRFKLNTDSMKLSMRATNNNIGNMNVNSVYATTLQDMERSLDAVQGLRQDGGKTFWISGLYDQGKLGSMLGNPAATEHHWGIMVGCHYKDAKTKQIFGIAVDVGIADSIAETDKDLKTDVKSAQLTLYYNKTFAENWKFNIHGNYMRGWDRHQRPVSTPAGKLLAIAHGIVHEFSLSGEFNYKYKIDGRNDHYWKPFVGFHYAYDLQDPYRESNVGIYNKKYEKTSGDQLGIIFGAKANLSYKINETKSFVFLPKISWTHYLKMLRLYQWSENISSGVRSRAGSGTPGRDLLSASLGFGINDSESQTSWKVAYTGNVQEKRKSHEIMLDFGIQF